jgi:hypothetical protein
MGSGSKWLLYQLILIGAKVKNIEVISEIICKVIIDPELKKTIFTDKQRLSSNRSGSAYW